MGRRKIEIAYLNDDRVRKVTFCKRKGGLFKKADDLAKLCGVEVAVVICGESKTHEFASTSVDRILRRYGEMQAGTSDPTVDDNNKLWEQLESQSRGTGRVKHDRDGSADDDCPPDPSRPSTDGLRCCTQLLSPRNGRHQPTTSSSSECFHTVEPDVEPTTSTTWCRP